MSSSPPPSYLRQLAQVLNSGRPEAAILAAFAALAGLTILFVKVAEEVIEGDTGGFDRALLLAFRTSGNPADPIGPAWLAEAMRDVTALGSTAVLTLLVITVTGFLLIMHKRQSALMIVLSVVGGTVLGSLMKIGFGRPRPAIVPHLTEVSSASFPSGHSMMSAVVYLTLGALLARTQQNTGVKIYIFAMATGLAMLVGISRVYLGVHWPTDVLAGWALGSLWALMCWAVMVWLQGQGRVEGGS